MMASAKIGMRTKSEVVVSRGTMMDVGDAEVEVAEVAVVTAMIGIRVALPSKPHILLTTSMALFSTDS